MDQSSVLIGISGFIAGYFFRASFPEPKLEPTACHCQCQWSGTPPIESHQIPSSLSFWLIAFGLVLITILALGNAALVCKISWKDSGGEPDREILINVKGKSKGIHGAARGLAITG